MNRYISTLLLESGRTVRLLLASSIVLALVVLVLAPLAFAEPAPVSRDMSSAALPTDEETTSAPRHSNQESSHVTVAKIVSTGTDDNRTVFTGERITYTIVITNHSIDTPVTDITLLDELPREALQDITCFDGCEKVVVSDTIPEPTGGTIVVTTTRRLSWTLTSLQPQSSATRVFTGVVIAHDRVLRNQAFVSYEQNGVVENTSSNETETSARIRLNQTGTPSLSSVPAWYSNDLGGTISQDWGDFDLDGNMDLVLASSAGTTVYRHTGERLVKFWDNDRLAYDAKWADFNNDGTLQIVTVGRSQDNTPATAGTNYVYSRDGSRFLQTGSFTSTYQLVRVEVGDFDNDGHTDLVVATNSINAPCPLRLYLNDGAGVFAYDNSRCVSTRATAAIGPGDFNNDGYLDLALGLFPNEVRLFLNENGSFFYTNTIPIVDSTSFLPYDFAWGDFDGDGYLDLAAGYPLERVARVYRNDAGTGFGRPTVLRTSKFLTPLAVDWGDFTGDGRIDLAVADAPPKIFRYTGNSFIPATGVPKEAPFGQLWSMRATDKDGDGDLDLTISNRDDPSIAFENFGAFLDTRIVPVESAPASSVAWGDADDDGDLDLLFGAGAGASGFSSRLYYSNNGEFTNNDMDELVGFGPHDVAFADVDRTGHLDIVVGFGSAVANRLYLAGNTGTPDWSSAAPHFPSYSMAWADADLDRDLDLLVGNNGPNRLYLNRNRDAGRATGQILDTSSVWTSEATDDTRSVAWGDFDGDLFPDFAVGNANGPNRIYRNSGDNTFNIVWESDFVSNTRAVAWGDFTGSGELDLAVGNYGDVNLVYQNQDGVLSKKPIWVSEDKKKTTSLAWGDWNSDGYLDLAVGNDQEPDQVFANLNSTVDSPQLYWLWTSQTAYRTSGVAWGDFDRDGDLDLAVSQASTGANGYYVNTYRRNSHLASDATELIPLPTNPPYVAVRRPGNSGAAYYYSSGDVLALPTRPTVTIEYTVYDPDGERVSPGSGQPGTPLVKTFYEYSLDGGGMWQPATAAASSPAPITQTSRSGNAGTFIWNAQADAAVSENALFRVRVVPKHVPGGSVQYPSSTGVSPPFRTRALTCFWPAGAGIGVSWSTDTPRPEPGQSITFIGTIVEGSGVLRFEWDFGDGNTKNGQIVSHTYEDDGTFSVTLTVRGQPCPITKVDSVTRTLTVGTGLNPSAYLPIVRADGDGPNVTTAVEHQLPGSQRTLFDHLLSRPSPVDGLQGSSDEAGVRLTWQHNPVSELIRGYHVYRRPIDETDGFTRIGTIPATETTFTDVTATCGQSYFVTAFNYAGESSASTASYRTLPCTDSGQ